MAEDNAAAAANEDVRSERTSSGGSADPQVEARARRMGWRTEADFEDGSMERRPPKFLSAEEYIEKVESDLPILRERNRFLDNTVSKLESKLDETAKELKTNNTRMDELGKLVEDLHSQNQAVGKRAYEAAKRDLEAVKRRAVSEADEATYDEADRRLSELDRYRPDDTPKPKKQAADDDEPAPKRQAETPPAPKISRVAQDWIDSNKDLMTDPVTNPVAVSLHTRNMASGMTETESLAKLTEQIKAEFPHKFNNARREAPSTVAGSSPQGRTTKKQTFDSLPADAKQTYERLERYMASKGKSYTKETYAKDYYVNLEESRS